MGRRFWIVVAVLGIVSVGALRFSRAEKMAEQDSLFQDLAHGICLSQVMRKVMDRSSSKPPAWYILSRQGDDALFQTQLNFQTQIDKSTHPMERERLEKDRLVALLTIMRRESPELIAKCDRLAAGMAKCMGHGEDKEKTQKCLAVENEAVTKEIFLYLNRYLEQYLPNVFDAIRKG